MKLRVLLLATATASMMFAGDGSWTEAQVKGGHESLIAIQNAMVTWVKANEGKKADCGELVKKIIGSSAVAGPAATKFTGGKTVNHDTDAPHECTLFFTGNGNAGQIVGIGFHTGNSSSVYNLYYKNPGWAVPTSEMNLATDYAATPAPRGGKKTKK